MGIILLRSWLCLYGSLGLCLGSSCSRSEQQNQVRALWQCPTLKAIQNHRILMSTCTSPTCYCYHILFLTLKKQWKNLEGKDPQFSICSKLKFCKSLNAIEHIVCIKEVFFLQTHTHTHTVCIWNILLSIHPALKILEVKSQPCQYTSVFTPVNGYCQMFERQAPSTLKTPLSSVSLNRSKRQTLKSIFKSICYEVSEGNFIYITYVLNQAINKVRSLVSVISRRI